MAIEIERRVCLFSLTAFFRFTETYAPRIQSANPNFDEEKQKVHNKDLKKSLINNDKKSRRWVFFSFLQSQIVKSVLAPGCQANSIWKQTRWQHGLRKHRAIEKERRTQQN